MNMELPTNLKLFKLPQSGEVLLFLISEEMKNRRHVNRLMGVGFDAMYTCDLSTLILTLAGFDERSDSVYEWYTALLDRYCEKASPADTEKWKEAVFEMYMEIKKTYR
jgi:hypothetical protein